MAISPAEIPTKQTPDLEPDDGRSYDRSFYITSAAFCLLVNDLLPFRFGRIAQETGQDDLNRTLDLDARQSAEALTWQLTEAKTYGPRTVHNLTASRREGLAGWTATYDAQGRLGGVGTLEGESALGVWATIKSILDEPATTERVELLRERREKAEAALAELAFAREVTYSYEPVVQDIDTGEVSSISRQGKRKLDGEEFEQEYRKSKKALGEIGFASFTPRLHPLHNEQQILFTGYRRAIGKNS